jgi:hypothetical protein
VGLLIDDLDRNKVSQFLKSNPTGLGGERDHQKIGSTTVVAPALTFLDAYMIVVRPLVQCCFKDDSSHFGKWKWERNKLINQQKIYEFVYPLHRQLEAGFHL